MRVRISKYAALAALTVLAGCATQQPMAEKSAEPYHIRGTLAAVDGGKLAIVTDDGSTVAVTLGEGAGIFIVDDASMDDILPGKFVGITSIESGGRRVALEVHVFDEALRGLAEGHYPWDLVAEPNMMTNAAVGSVLDKGAGARELRVTYWEAGVEIPDKGGVSVFVPPDAKFVTLSPTTADKLVPGEAIWVLATDTDTGIVSPAVAIGQNGIAPPF